MRNILAAMAGFFLGWSSPPQTAVENPVRVEHIGKPMAGRCSFFSVGPSSAINPRASGSYCAMRWDYDALAREAGVPRKEIKSVMRTWTVRVVNPANGKAVDCLPADWGPAPWTNRMIDLDTKTRERLGLRTDDRVIATLERMTR